MVKLAQLAQLKCTASRRCFRSLGVIKVEMEWALLGKEYEHVLSICQAFLKDRKSLSLFLVTRSSQRILRLHELNRQNSGIFTIK